MGIFVFMSEKVAKVPNLRFPEFEEEWDEKRLGEIISIKTDKYNPLIDKKEHTCIELESLSQDSGELLSVFNSKNQKSIKNVFYSGDVLFGKLRPYLRKYFLANFDGVCSSEIWVMKSNFFSSEYLYSFVQSNFFLSLTEISSGSKMPRADWSLIATSIINYPSSSTEREKVGKLVSSLNQRIQTQNKIIEGLQSFKNAISKRIFSLQLRFMDSNNKTFPDWRAKYLKDVCQVIGGGTPETSKPNYWNGNIQWFTPTEIKRDFVCRSERTISELGLKNSSAKLLPKGTILLTTRATIGEVAIALEECATNQGFQSLVVKNGHNNVFVFNWLKEHKHEFIKRASGSTFPEISKSEIEKIEINIPSLQEQTLIADFLSSIDRKIESEKRISEQYQYQKMYLLQSMFI